MDRWKRRLIRIVVSPNLAPWLLTLFALFFCVLFKRDELDIKYNEQGATIITRAAKTEKASILLPSTKIWVNTGLHVKPSQTIHVNATGAINLAIHRQVHAADRHTPPRIGWIGPEGIGAPFGNSLDNGRQAYLIMPDAPQGTILAYIATENEILGKFNARPKGVTTALKASGISSRDGGVLWLTVNDVVLNEHADSAFNSSQEALNQVYGKTEKGESVVTVQERQEQWQRIKTSGYYEAFFDDNAGDFFVQIEYDEVAEHEWFTFFRGRKDSERR